MNQAVKNVLDIYADVQTKTASILGAGEHRVKLVKASVTSSDRNFDGTDSEKSKPWADPNIQLILQLTNSNGSCVIRKPMIGYVQKRDGVEPSATQKFLSSTDKDGKSFNEEYLCDISAEGVATRVMSTERTEKCKENISAIASAFGKGNALEVLNTGASTGTEITVVLKDREGRVEFSHFRKSAPAAVLTNEML